MTTSENFHPPAAGGAAERYVRELGRTHAARRYPGLAGAVQGEPLCRLDGYGDGLTTVSFRESQLPGPFFRGVLGFRLTQFLQLGLMDPDLVYQQGLVHEPVIPSKGPETIHTVTVTDSGQIVGYIGLVGSDDAAPLPLDSAARARFPAEVAHDVDLLASHAASGRTSHNAYEVKRFVRERSMPRGAQSDRVPWHLILAIGTVGLRLEEIHVVLGDSGERGALRHLRLLGFDLVVVEGTQPRLPRSELMWPSYEFPREKLAKPFVGALPHDLAEYMKAIESGLADDDTESRRMAIVRLMELHRSRETQKRLQAA